MAIGEIGHPDGSSEQLRMQRLLRQRFQEEESKVSVQIRLRHQDDTKLGYGIARYGVRIGRGLIISSCIAWVSLPAFAGSPQVGAAQGQPRPIVIPNRTLDPHELNDLERKDAKRRNLDAANAARKRVIDDETNRLLILARDLKAKTDRLGTGTLTPTMVREAEVIELLANDVKEEMKLTVNAD